MGALYETIDPEAAYASLADELNDFDVRITCARCGAMQLVKVQCASCGNDLDPLADFDADCVEAGEQYATANGLAWPPQVGDFDRYYEQKVNAR
jgi:hypothetical protein